MLILTARKELVMKKYSDSLSKKGLNARLPSIDVWPNQFPNYEIKIDIPEFTSVCPKTKLPDFGRLRLTYMPNKKCIELKSLKYYILAYRDLGIFYENAVNRILADIVKTTKPKWAKLSGTFNARGGIETEITALFGKVPK